jgi:hypothetical protein
MVEAAPVAAQYRPGSIPTVNSCKDCRNFGPGFSRDSFAIAECAARDSSGVPLRSKLTASDRSLLRALIVGGVIVLLGIAIAFFSGRLGDEDEDETESPYPAAADILREPAGSTPDKPGAQSAQ